jgi:hypothetical protein
MCRVVLNRHIHDLFEFLDPGCDPFHDVAQKDYLTSSPLERPELADTFLLSLFGSLYNVLLNTLHGLRRRADWFGGRDYSFELIVGRLFQAVKSALPVIIASNTRSRWGALRRSAEWHDCLACI